MLLPNNTIAAFDFDGTITTKDTLFDFIEFYVGKKKLLTGLFILSPLLISYKLGFIKNDIAKQRLFAHFFKNKNIEEFNRTCQNYIPRIEKIARAEIIDKIRWHQNQGHLVIIISASISNWIQPWANKIGIDNIIATEISIKNNRIKGIFSTPNCYGQEKVNRLLKLFPNRDEYTLYAYGDSLGDKELFSIANHINLIKK